MQVIGVLLLFQLGVVWTGKKKKKRKEISVSNPKFGRCYYTCNCKRDVTGTSNNNNKIDMAKT